ncbi:MAG: hypothetical protein U1D55_02535 [Phycisphaerae bacterium]
MHFKRNPFILAIVFGLAVQETLGQACVGWQAAAYVPAPRKWHDMFYDSARGNLVMMGGHTHDPPRNFTDMCAWDGTRWRRLPTVAIYTGTGAGTVFDRRRNVAVKLLGGVREWDGAQWLLRDNSSLPFSGVAGLVYDEARAVTVAQAGASTWTWDGAAWTLRASNGPLLGFGGRQLTFDSLRQVVVAVESDGDTWEWDGTTWAQRGTAAFSSTFSPYPTFTFDRRRGVSVLVRDRELWEWDGVAWTQRAAPPFGERYSHAAAYHDGLQQIVLFGGTDGFNYFNDMWSWDGQTWRIADAGGLILEVAPNIANADASARLRAVYDENLGAIVMLGWQWDGVRWTNMPRPRSSSYRDELVFDSARGVLTHFGIGGTSIWDGVRWKLLDVPGPTSRAYPAMTYDERRKVAVLFGGRESSLVWLGDTWEWDGAHWTQLAAAGPLARFAGCMAYDSNRAVTVLHGGYGFRDTWEWDGANWSKRADLGPYTDTATNMAFDASRGVCVLLGSAVGSETLWEWDGQSWSSRLLHGPGPRISPMLAYDRRGGAVFMYGNADWPAAKGWYLRDRLFGDLDQSGVVDAGDLAIVLASFEVDDGGDLDGDGVTNSIDLAQILSLWGDHCP